MNTSNNMTQDPTAAPRKRNQNTRKMVLASLFSALMAICAWISIPVAPIAFTLQTFGILMALGVLGGKWGTMAIGLYLAMGVVGLPVFSGFRGGAGALLGATGGFLWGFLVGGLLYCATEKFGKLPAFLVCHLCCYVCGCLWFTVWAGGASISAAVMTCVVPYLIPDAIKLLLAYHLSERIKKYGTES